ncbi:MAG: hypothetical protein ACE14W_07315 [Candidatus Velamenicoccus archaeovorus]
MRWFAKPASILVPVLVLASVTAGPGGDGPPPRSLTHPNATPRAHAPHRRTAPARPDLGVYRGLGTWIDVYDVAWRHPGIAVRRMRRRGVETLYLQTSNHSRTRPFVFKEGVERFVDAAHRNGISVVAWYLPGLRDLRTDFRRSMAAIRFRTARGNRFDSFAMDIEDDGVRRPGVRTERLLRLSRWIRRAGGPSYPLGAIIPSPLRLRTDTRYWPHFPYRRLARLYDVFLPMTYFTYRVHGRSGARWYTGGNIRLIRQQTGDREVPIHVIGGIGGAAGSSETAGFVHAVRGHHVIGASYYTFPFVSEQEWRELAKVPRRAG